MTVQTCNITKKKEKIKFKNIISKHTCTFLLYLDDKKWACDGFNFVMMLKFINENNYVTQFILTAF